MISYNISWRCRCPWHLQNEYSDANERRHLFRTPLLALHSFILSIQHDFKLKMLVVSVLVQSVGSNSQCRVAFISSLSDRCFRWCHWMNRTKNSTSRHQFYSVPEHSPLSRLSSNWRMPRQVHHRQLSNPQSLAIAFEMLAQGYGFWVPWRVSLIHILSSVHSFPKKVQRLIRESSF